jgi:hypothetical protein
VLIDRRRVVGERGPGLLSRANAAATMTSQTALAKATSATIRRKLIHVPARIAFTARRVSLHLPTQ